MSAVGDALSGIKQILLIQKQVEDLESAAEVQARALHEMGRDVIAIDKRVVRIETMVELSTARAAPRQPRLPKS